MMMTVMMIKMMMMVMMMILTMLPHTNSSGEIARLLCKKIKCWSWFNYHCSASNVRMILTMHKNIIETWQVFFGKGGRPLQLEMVQGWGRILQVDRQDCGLVSCPTRWSLYLPLALCTDHQFGLGGRSNISLPHIGGSHPVPSLSILSTERWGTAMYYHMGAFQPTCMIFSFEFRSLLQLYKGSSTLWKRLQIPLESSKLESKVAMIFQNLFIYIDCLMYRCSDV